MVTVMKKMNIASKIVAFTLAAFMLLGLASCDASMNEAEDMFADSNGGATEAGAENSGNGMSGAFAENGGNTYPFYNAAGNAVITNPSFDFAGDAEMDEEIKLPAGTEGNIEMERVPGEENNYIENSFISTAENSMSTFSADVDTASYTYFRKMVEKGYTLSNLRNSGSQFRIEEFINYFRYDVQAPSAENELFGVKTGIIPCPWSRESMLLRVTLQAEEAVNEQGNNLVFLIDVSGSMSSSDKLPLLKKAFSYLVSNLDADDTVSIVTYSGREAVVLEGCNGLETDKIMNAINNLGASGSTNGEAGLTMAYRIAESYFKPEGNNRIIMASDGDLNVGISSASELTSYIEEKRDQGVYLSVLGFGTGNYRDSNMEALADNGNGVYYYIDGETEAEKVFGTDLFGTLYTVAEDVKLQLEFNPELVSSYRLVGYENRVMANEDFENDAKDAGEVGASHQVTVFYEIKLAAYENDKSPVSPFVTLRVRHKKPGESLSILNEYYVTDIESDISEDEKFMVAVIETCMLLRGSKYAVGITVDGIVEELEALDLGGDTYKTEFRDLIKKLAGK